jgi:hypothetical protein
MYKNRLFDIINETLKDESEIKYTFEEVAVDNYDLDLDALEKEFSWL